MAVFLVSCLQCNPNLDMDFLYARWSCAQVQRPPRNAIQRNVFVAIEFSAVDPSGNKILMTSLLFLSSFQWQRTQRGERHERRRDDVEPPAAGGVRAACVQVVWLQVEAEPGAEQPEHDSGQRNNVSTYQAGSRGIKREGGGHEHITTKKQEQCDN